MAPVRPSDSIRRSLQPSWPNNIALDGPELSPWVRQLIAQTIEARLQPSWPNNIVNPLLRQFIRQHIDYRMQPSWPNNIVLNGRETLNPEFRRLLSQHIDSRLQPSWPNNTVLDERERLNPRVRQLIGQNIDFSSRGYQSTYRVSEHPVYGHRSSTNTPNYVASQQIREGNVASGHEAINSGPANGAASLSSAVNQVVLQDKTAEIDPYEVALAKYQNLFDQRLQELRNFIALLYSQKRIDVGVHDELMAYFSKNKFGDRPSAKSLSEYACQALVLSEQVFGTHLSWAKGVTPMFGPYGPAFEKMTGESMEDHGLVGPGFVGEEDLESWVGNLSRWEGSMIGEPSRKGKGKGKGKKNVVFELDE